MKARVLLVVLALGGAAQAAHDDPPPPPPRHGPMCVEGEYTDTSTFRPGAVTAPVAPTNDADDWLWVFLGPAVASSAYLSWRLRRLQRPQKSPLPRAFWISR